MILFYTQLYNLMNGCGIEGCMLAVVIHCHHQHHSSKTVGDRHPLSILNELTYFMTVADLCTNIE